MGKLRLPKGHTQDSNSLSDPEPSHFALQQGKHLARSTWPPMPSGPIQEVGPSCTSILQMGKLMQQEGRNIKRVATERNNRIPMQARALKRAHCHQAHFLATSLLSGHSSLVKSLADARMHLAGRLAALRLPPTI